MHGARSLMLGNSNYMGHVALNAEAASIALHKDNPTNLYIPDGAD